MKWRLNSLLAAVNLFMIQPPPSPFLSARDLNSRYATQIRKLSNAPWVTDGDAAFYKVDTRRPAHELEEGVAADAVNKRFEDGRAWPRLGVVSQPWGKLPLKVIAGGGYPPDIGDTVFYAVSGDQVQHGGSSPVLLRVGTDGSIVSSLPYVPANLGWIEFDDATGHQSWIQIPQNSVQVFISSGYTLSFVDGGKPCGFERFNDPDGNDTLALAMDGWRSGSGEDGGRGRVWKIMAGNAPVEVPMNGNDVWGPARFIPCFNGLVLLRQGNERHYFSAAAVATSQIQLNCTPNWQNGDKVLYVASANSAILGTKPPNPNARYYVKNVGGNKIELYSDSTLATQMTFTSAQGTFYLERQADFPGFYGNGAPPLLAQPTAAGETLWQNGFLSIAATVQVTSTDNTTNILTAPNHRLIPGDPVTVTGIHTTGNVLIGGLAFAAPLDDHHLKLYSNAVAALSAGTSSLIPLANNNETGTLTKSGASGLPTPPGREGCYYQNRLVIVNGRDTLAISDPLDPLHFTPFQAALTANLGESDLVQAVRPYGSDSLLIEKENSILLLGGFSGGPNAWTLTAITREYGLYAPLSLSQVGTDAWGLSRKGVASVTQTVQGIVQGVAEPVSREMQKYINTIDWRFASQAVGAYWNNRYFLAVPLKGQVAPVQNNGILVYNFLNQGWEGLWQGTALQVYGFARHIVYGEERVCFVDYNGQVNWLGDAFIDDSAVGGPASPIADLLLTRRYVANVAARKLWLEATVLWDTNNPSLTVTAVAPGYNETVTLASGLTYDPTKYLVNGPDDYDPAAATEQTFDTPDREDYSLSAQETLVGTLDAHQDITEKFRMRLDDWGVQVQIENAQGSARIQAVGLRGVAGPALGTKNV